MKLFPAIDLKDKQVVRLYKGDYNQMTVYGTNPLETAKGFKAKGAEYLHVVDLDGAKDGDNPNFAIVADLAANSGLKVEIGGGIRNEEIIKRYIDAGVMRVILGTVAISDPDFVADMVNKYGDKIAVGVDMLGGKVATHGWTNVSEVDGFEFCKKLDDIGVATVICTDISKDGAMQGTNRELYKEMVKRFKFDTVASGGVSTLEDVIALNEMDIYGAILGKALYTGAIDLADVVKITSGDR
ncbi:MAG: 1-(5-phosphoribosyl)-5-[(5-phosphoribosylamino)methylideneamino]imidazole-4-carboxamide isomerase [Clostridia bacterium]|nr:1-(5-phosphoribosyl)-5-[(5-phosphoribosylamino)methylideneamino]imidazole-4-carboxamide isomerase [Clostridia bacterium]